MINIGNNINKDLVNEKPIRWEVKTRSLFRYHEDAQQDYDLFENALYQLSTGLRVNIFGSFNDTLEYLNDIWIIFIHYTYRWLLLFLSFQ